MRVRTAGNSLRRSSPSTGADEIDEVIDFGTVRQRFLQTLRLTQNGGKGRPFRQAQAHSVPEHLLAAALQALLVPLHVEQRELARFEHLLQVVAEVRLIRRMRRPEAPPCFQGNGMAVMPLRGSSESRHLSR